MKLLEDLTQIGRVLKPQGLKGVVKILPLTNNPEYYTCLKLVYLSQKNQIANSDTKFMQYPVQHVRYQSDLLCFKFVSVDDRNLAEPLQGMSLWILNQDLKPLADEEFFVHDFVGSKVYNHDLEYLGEVVHYFDNGNHGVGEVHGVKKFLFPTTKEVMLHFDAAQKKVVIRPLPGMLEL